MWRARPPRPEAGRRPLVWRATPQIETLPTHVSPVDLFTARALNESVPAVSLATLRTVNESLAPWVLRVPWKILWPSWKSFTVQACPDRLESTSNSASIPLSSGESFSFQSLDALHEPRLITSPDLAPAGAAPATVGPSPAARPSVTIL